jgi:hypothetical protein
LYSGALEGSMASPRGYHDLVERRFMSASGTNAKCRLALKLSAYRGRPEVNGAQSE